MRERKLGFAYYDTSSGVEKNVAREPVCFAYIHVIGKP